MVRKPTVRKRQATWVSADLRQEQHDAKRRLILKQAAVLFADRGFHETTIDQIAEALDVTKPTIYYYIENKEDLLFQVAHAALVDLNEVLAQDRSTGSLAIDRLEHFFTLYGRLILSEFGVCLALVSDRSLNPQSRQKLRALKKQFEVTVQEILNQGREDGTIRVDDPRIFTFAIFGAFNWMPQWFSNSGTLSPEAAAELMFREFRKAVI